MGGERTAASGLGGAAQTSARPRRARCAAGDVLNLVLVQPSRATAPWRPLRRPARRLRPEIYAKLTPLPETLANGHGPHVAAA